MYIYIPVHPTYSGLAEECVLSVVKVWWDVRERRSPTSNLWLKAFPRLRLL